MNCRGGAT
jgi:hypothetical protein